jgi:hypothetical protein
MAMITLFLELNVSWLLALSVKAAAPGFVVKRGSWPPVDFGWRAIAIMLTDITKYSANSESEDGNRWHVLPSL